MSSGLNITDKFDYFEEGINGTATKNTTTSLDYKISTEDKYLSGGELITENHVWGDWIEVQVVDVDGVYYDAGTVLKQYIKKRYLCPSDCCTYVESWYAGLIKKDLYMRIKYHSVGTVNDVKVAVNYYLHIPDNS